MFTPERWWKFRVGFRRGGVYRRQIVWLWNSMVNPSSSHSQIAGASLAETAEFPLHLNVPVEYAGFQQVEGHFSSSASLLWLVLLELYPGISPTRGSLYWLLAPETVAMNEYIKEAWVKGFIRRSISPAVWQDSKLSAESRWFQTSSLSQLLRPLCSWEHSQGFLFCKKEGWKPQTLYCLLVIQSHHN